MVLTVDIPHALLATVYIFNRVVHWVMEYWVQWSLVTRNVCWITIEYLSNHKSPTCLIKRLPEALFNMSLGINSISINIILLSQVSNPPKKLIINPLIILIQIREPTKPTILNRVLIIPVDITVIVIVIAAVEGLKLREIRSRSHVVGNNIHHHPDALIMSGFNK